MRGVCPKDKDAERDAFLQLIAGVPKKLPLAHYGDMLPRWFSDSGVPQDRIGIESRFVDLARRLRGAAIYPGPIFGQAQHVAFALERDPYRAGDGDAAAMHAAAEDGEAWLLRKGESDLKDLCDLVAFVRDHTREAQAESERDAAAEKAIGAEGGVD